MIEDVTQHDPLSVFGDWFAQAEASEPADPNAFTLATADARGQPSARIVLLKEWDSRGFVFYTNTASRKGQQLAENARAGMLFHWKSLQRQVRIEGLVDQVSDAQADAYFAGRPRQSQVGAWASDQSRPLDSRATFEQRVKEMEARFAGQEVPRPPHWHGYRITPHLIEFWVERPYRLHDRWVFTRHEGADPKAPWQVARLFP